MPPRPRLRPNQPILRPPQSTTPYLCHQCRLASLATTPAPPIEPPLPPAPTIARHPPTQPPSHKPPEFRKSQLHRQYQSLLRSSPLTLLFQHNNLKATEWMGVRRELVRALRKVDDEIAEKNEVDGGRVGEGMKLCVVQTGIFASALRVVEFWDPRFEGSSGEEGATHGLSATAWQVSTKQHKSHPQGHGLEPLLSGPLALLTFPSVSPAHVKAALSILAPSKNFPAPRRRANPSYHDPAVQNGVAKLLLLAARVEGRVLDEEGVKWMGGLEGGVEGLRGQLVALLQGVGAGLAGTLEGVGRGLWVTVEGRRGMLEELEEKGQ